MALSAVLALLLALCVLLVPRPSAPATVEMSSPAVAALKRAPLVLAATTQPATGAFVFLHGLGDQGDGWAMEFASLREPHLDYIFPNANSMAVTVNGGMRMPSWFDYLGLSHTAPEDEKGIERAAEQVRAILADISARRNIPSHRIVLGGFSQGGALALYTALTHDKPLAGVVALSAYLPLRTRFPAALSLPHAAQLPILQCHGDADPIVDVRWAVATASLLRSMCPNYEFVTLPGLGHASSSEEMRRVRAFVQKHLPAS